MYYMPVWNYHHCLALAVIGDAKYHTPTTEVYLVFTNPQGADMLSGRAQHGTFLHPDLNCKVMNCMRRSQAENRTTVIQSSSTTRPLLAIEPG